MLYHFSPQILTPLYKGKYCLGFLGPDAVLPYLPPPSLRATHKRAAASRSHRQYSRGRHQHAPRLATPICRSERGPSAVYPVCRLQDCLVLAPKGGAVIKDRYIPGGTAVLAPVCAHHISKESLHPAPMDFCRRGGCLGPPVRTVSAGKRRSLLFHLVSNVLSALRGFCSTQSLCLGTSCALESSWR